jgi:predicted membrane chloride channel (bestrophin family)
MIVRPHPPLWKLFFIPFGFADMLSWRTSFATTLVAYTFFGLDVLGDGLEEPFGMAAQRSADWRYRGYD